MKTIRKIFAILIVLFIYSCVNQRPVAAQQGQISFQVFYDQLSPYGQWADNPNYGYVWFPDAGRDFFPYSTNGYWVMTNYGWTWVSDYSWGWAPFHYGRWDYDNYYGWFWVPDNEWGPSWVTWRRADGYYGWSPMRPGASFNISYGGRYFDMDRWIFVSERDFGRHDINRYYVNRGNNNMIIRNSTVINNTYIDNSRHVTYIAGPPRADVQRATGRNINSVNVRDDIRPGERIDNNHLTVYRPQVQRITNGSQKSVPSRTINMKEVRPPAERSTVQQRNNVESQQNDRRVIQQPQPQQQRQDMQRQQQPKQQVQEQKKGQENQQVQGRRGVEKQEQQNRLPKTTPSRETRRRR